MKKETKLLVLQIGVMLALQATILAMAWIAYTHPPRTTPMPPSSAWAWALLLVPCGWVLWRIFAGLQTQRLRARQHATKARETA